MTAQLSLWSSPGAAAPPHEAAVAPVTAKAAPGLSHARARARVGMDRAADRAEDSAPGWTDTAAAYLARYATQTACGEPWLLEDAREASLRSVPVPPNPKAWGKAVQVAARRGWIRPAGYAPARSSNGSPKCLWRSA